MKLRGKRRIRLVSLFNDVYNFINDISPKVNVIVRYEFEPAVQQFSYKTTRHSPPSEKEKNIRNKNQCRKYQQTIKKKKKKKKKKKSVI